MAAPGRRGWRSALAAAVGLLVVLVGAAALAGCAGSGPSESTSPKSTVATQTTEGDASGTVVPTTGTAAQPATSAVPGAGELQVHVIDVGHGDAILIRSPEGKVMLIDGGAADSGALEYLLARGVDHVDLMVATHSDKDHIGGLVEVLHALPVAAVVTNGLPDTGKTYAGFLDAVADATAAQTAVKRGDTLQLGGLTFAVLSPGDSPDDDPDESSLVLRLVYGGTSFLFAADTGKKAEKDMLASGEDLAAEVLKVGHHGSGSSSSKDFLAAVAPAIAVYSADGESSDQPNKKTLSALAERGIEVYGTDVDGSLSLISDGTSIRVSAEKGEVR